MTALSLPDILNAARRLSRAERQALLKTLQLDLIETAEPAPSPETLAQERAALRDAGAFAAARSLHGAFAHPDLDLTWDELDTLIRDVNQAWESDPALNDD